MQFSWLIFFLTMAFVIIEAVVSIMEGTFSRKQRRHVNLSFCWHWGVSIGDLVLLPIINALFFPFLYFSWWFILSFFVSLIMTAFLHKAWWSDPKNKYAQGFILLSTETKGASRKFWYKAMTKAGWIHFAFTVYELTLLSGYIFTPMPNKVVLIVGAFFIGFVPLTTVESGIVQSGGYKRLMHPENNSELLNLVLTIANILCIIFAVTFIKLKGWL